jgi:glycolate oxidase iron-sulfur subunit
MRTDFSAQILATSSGARANEILRACVHCGFCNATCPTYQLTGDELDGPRGRIYLIRELLQGSEDVDRATRHLDRCLTCRACETTCPSGVAYGELAEIARNHLGPDRDGLNGRLRKLLQWMVPVPRRLRAMARLGRAFRWFAPPRFAKNLPARVGKPLSAKSDNATRVLLLNGCAQQVNSAATNEHLAQLLRAHDIGVMTIADEACCGGLDLHLGDDSAALGYVRRNVDALHPRLGEIDAVLSTASGCGVTVKDYGRLLEHDEHYALRAAEVAAKTMDVSEYLLHKDLSLAATQPGMRIAWHSPCTLQHGQQLNGVVENMLHEAGYELTSVPDAHLCCGSAGTYSMLQPTLAEQLKQNKIAALTSGEPDIIATANVGCQTHIAAGAKLPVLHWIELLK